MSLVRMGLQFALVVKPYVVNRAESF